MINRNELLKIIEDKFRYLFINEFIGRYDLIKLDVDLEWEVEKGISILYLNFGIDDLNANDGTTQDMVNMLKTTESRIIEFLYKYPLNPKNYKIETNFEDVYISAASFSEIKFLIDEKHYMLINFLLSYERL